MIKPKELSVSDYIASFPEDIQERLNSLRDIIQKLAPEAEESMSYGMPAYKLHKKPLVYFAGYSGHIGFYATPNGHEEFKEELSKYKGGKGSVQFPLDQKLPKALIQRIVKFRKQHIEEALKKSK